MHNITWKSLLAILFSGALFSFIHAPAQLVEVTAAPATSDGTVSKVSAQSIIITKSTGEQPVEYLSSETTHYVDVEGNPVDIAMMKSGLPVTVHYTQTGDSLVATKVVLGKARVVISSEAAEKDVVAAMNMAGTISELGESRFLIRTETSPDPVSYTYSKTTTYMDEEGKPVDVSVVKTGIPVTVYYTKVGDSMVVSRVVVRKAKLAPTQEIERKKTTTTETTTDR
ncbi:hypothetical protein [Verrucomicrobium sp. BvORR106]|uniref:hypothetical protein n=1 Tax=Verrucomicrobium sp. BvORR106 TaxID=1403819 RepID=UPI00056F5163|nr:hypothetical protein [Verrucomicrobium sp. BvORR106]